MTSLIRRVLCRIGHHRQLDIIQTFRAAQHVGCPDCRRRYAIHHGLRTFVPWDSDFADLYEGMGYDTAHATNRWFDYLDTREHRP
ncbi:hypothetical protein ACFFTN_01150 [Aminobacter aganoensis]|uniref:Uncharacterized protein n=1 Tax=Aminobacter aganoensis TaxID=83264 RepID=A0A7X0F5L6_9HYPH|nr:hypothetical protein [Aminobacter aganoensis]MBB6353537.1 hypothetical protein [Aminobacter aganoensis]